jgi:glyoxylase-like metal-dependent hydrolase (beta-lactamase superfamily II)
LTGDFIVKEIVNTDSLRITSMPLGRYKANAYFVQCPATGECMLIDAPADAEAIMREFNGMQLQYIVLTHGQDRKSVV